MAARRPGLASGMLGLLQGTPLDTLKAWTIKEFLSNNAAILPTRFDQANFAFYGQTLRGTPEQRERWKRAIGETEGLLGELLGKSYAERYFPPASKAAMDELVGNLRKAMAQSIDEIDWMGEETKKQAMAKLASFDPKIGYRDNLDTYEGLNIETGDPIANRMAAARWAEPSRPITVFEPVEPPELFPKWMMILSTPASAMASASPGVVQNALVNNPFRLASSRTSTSR